MSIEKASESKFFLGLTKFKVKSNSKETVKKNKKGFEVGLSLKIHNQDKRVIYIQASRARLWLGVMGKI